MSALCDRCGTVLDRLPACPRCLLGADIGAHIVGEHYELAEEIGHGGMGTVYRACDRRDGSTVAVKLLREDLTEQPGFLERFRQESRALALMRHPGIVRLRDWGVDDTCAFIVMEYVAGRSLAGQLPMSPRRAKEIAGAIAFAVASAHRLGIVHRDLKPENILVGDDGTVKVSDFGIAAFARDHRGGARLTAAHQVIGTPAYMAPEALLGAAPDPRMDVFSLGVLFYEMVEGHPPQGYFEPPAPFSHVLKRALAADPARRYADAGEMARALAPEVMAAPVGPTRFERGGALVAAILVGVGLAALLAGLVPPPAGQKRLIAAGVVFTAGALLAQRLLHRWRQGGIAAESVPAHLPQTTGLLRFSLAALGLATLQAVAVWPKAAPVFAIALRAAQVGGIATFALGLLESGRVGHHDDEPWLWLGLLAVIASFGLALLGGLNP